MEGDHSLLRSIDGIVSLEEGWPSRRHMALQWHQLETEVRLQVLIGFRKKLLQLFPTNLDETDSSSQGKES